MQATIKVLSEYMAAQAKKAATRGRIPFGTSASTAHMLGYGSGRAASEGRQPRPLTRAHRFRSDADQAAVRLSAVLPPVNGFTRHYRGAYESGMWRRVMRRHMEWRRLLDLSDSAFGEWWLTASNSPDSTQVDLVHLQ